MAGGFNAHLAPQGDGFWHGLTGSPSPSLIAAALLAALLVWWLGRLVAVAPFLWMGLGLLPLMPAVFGLGAPLLFFSHYTMILVFAILVGWTSRDLVPALPRLEPSSVFVVSFVFFIFVGRFLPGPAGPQGDEPHYLLIAESLLRDGDVDLKNQFDERAFSKFTSADLEPHTAPRSPKGRLYAIHTPGLAALIAPGYAAFGFAGARAVVSLVMALVVSLLFLASRFRFGDANASVVAVLATFASPLPIYANSVFPDSVATLPVAATLAWMAATRPALLVLASISIAGLPWIHPRFLPLALVLSLGIALREGFSPGRAAAVFVPLTASAALLLAHFESLFGQASLSAAYGPGFSSDVSVAHIPWGASALLFDRQFGLLLFSPLALLSLSGVAALLRRDRGLATTALAAAGVLLGTGGGFSMWWGGASAPARFLIGGMPVLLLLAGASWPGPPDRQRILGATAGFGAGLLSLACMAPRVLHNRADGDSGLLRLLAPVLDADRFFPGFVRSADGPGLALFWGLILVILILRPRPGLWALACSLAIGVLTTSPPLLDPFSSSLRVLEAWDDHRKTFGGTDAAAAFSLDIPLGEVAQEVEPSVERLSPRFSLPGGSWTLRVRSSAVITPGALNVARLTLLGGEDGGKPLASVLIEAGDREALVNFDLPRDERRVRLRLEGLQSRTRIVRATLVQGLGRSN